MPTTAIIVGGLLIALGIGGYVASDQASKTALIPAGFGLVFATLGAIGLSGPGPRKHAMHGAAGLALLAVLGSARGLMGLPALLSGGQVERPLAVVSQSVMTLVCLVFLVLCVQSFIAARRARQVAAD